MLFVKMRFLANILPHGGNLWLIPNMKIRDTKNENMVAGNWRIKTVGSQDKLKGGDGIMDIVGMMR